MYFKNIIGQDTAKRFIINSIKKDRISHAYLFEGPSGVGKKTFAMEFSKILLDTNNLENSPDFKLLEPQGSSFKINQIRNMHSDIIVRPYKNKKIYILDDSDKMTVQAQNALLKTLEEPPEYAVLILIAKNSATILDTIKSRCEIIKFSPLPLIGIENYLINYKNIDKDKAKVLSSFSMGILSNALELLNSEEFNKKREEIENYINIMISKNVVDILNINSSLENNKEDINNILDILTTYFRDILLIKENVNENIIINIDKINFLQDLSKKLTYSQISSIIDIIEETKKKLMSNCNFNLAIGVMVLNIHEVIK
ncbi:DNA polymerase III subunit [Tepidibacter formicigenes]|jgi:DNA polymerase-3 subunit delta'|uniref:DNA polymerase III subunit delta' n=1 Tax=Tepidibacter formicigenes DSM 15518 TaxID=1123349 RepID=A0A1M6PPP8_9FIRM|nr:DNA polymerase III subunit delta' C-terminal domain-containing protein [Tepidibacter formicigenes]SHK09887.1 DNA polymerase-3 subunit delta' [Tepidibacter formicigenes DSM 15518]